MQACSNAIANALALLQSCTKPSILITKYNPFIFPTICSVDRLHLIVVYGL